MIRNRADHRSRPIILFAILCLIVGCHAPSRSSNIVRSLESLRSSLRTELKERPKETWTILHESVSLAASCSEEGLVLEKLLALAPFTGNAEFNEFLSEAVDQVVLSNAACFLSAWDRLPDLEKDWVATLVAHPTRSTEETLENALRESSRPEIARQILDRVRGLTDGSRKWPATP